MVQSTTEQGEAPIGHPAPALSANEIQAMYVQMRNSGQNCVGRLGEEPTYISIQQWRDEQLAKSSGLQADQ